MQLLSLSLRGRKKGKLFGLCSKEGKGHRSIDDFRDQRAHHGENWNGQTNGLSEELGVCCGAS